ncbi:MAG: epimerase [Frankiales bacterium]|nr:epimerase [Frankiales bacterium]
MKIFVTGGTGVVGRPLVPLLVEAGHDVDVVARTPERARLVHDLGARPVSLPAYDEDALATAAEGAEVVVDLTTAVPSLLRSGSRGAWRAHDRLRDAGTAAVVAAATRTGARRVVRDSVAFLHADGGDTWIDEDWPLDPGVHLASAVAAERHVRGFAGEGVVLRFGLLYGPLSSHTVSSARLARRLGVTPVLGPPDAYACALHHDDAARAVLAALTAPEGTYDVGDDVPLTRAETVAAQAAALGLRRLRQLPAAAGRGSTAAALTRSHRVRNRRFRDASGWQPRWPSAREGWLATAAHL